MTKPATPQDLRTDGAALWRKITGAYELRADELVTLTSACRATDRATLMRDELGDAVTATGSMGQVVVHPLIAEIRAHEAQVASLLTRLKLPDLAEGASAGEATRSTSARAAAQSRWGVAHGAGA